MMLFAMDFNVELKSLRKIDETNLFTLFDSIFNSLFYIK